MLARALLSLRAPAAESAAKQASVSATPSVVGAKSNDLTGMKRDAILDRVMGETEGGKAHARAAIECG